MTSALNFAGEKWLREYCFIITTIKILKEKGNEKDFFFTRRRQRNHRKNYKLQCTVNAYSIVPIKNNRLLRISFISIDKYNKQFCYNFFLYQLKLYSLNYFSFISLDIFFLKFMNKLFLGWEQQINFTQIWKTDHKYV